MKSVIELSVEFLARELSLLKDSNPSLVNHIIQNVINCNINNYPVVYNLFITNNLFCEENIVDDEKRVSLNSISITNLLFKFKIFLTNNKWSIDDYHNNIQAILETLQGDAQTGDIKFLDVLSETVKNRDITLLSNLLLVGSIYRLDLPMLMIKYLGGDYERDKT